MVLRKFPDVGQELTVIKPGPSVENDNRLPGSHGFEKQRRPIDIQMTFYDGVSVRAGNGHESDQKRHQHEFIQRASTSSESATAIGEIDTHQRLRAQGPQVQQLSRGK